MATKITSSAGKASAVSWAAGAKQIEVSPDRRSHAGTAVQDNVGPEGEPQRGSSGRLVAGKEHASVDSVRDNPLFYARGGEDGVVDAIHQPLAWCGYIERAARVDIALPSPVPRGAVSQHRWIDGQVGARTASCAPTVTVE